MHDGTGFAEAILGLRGFRITGVHETESEVVISIETLDVAAWCTACGVKAEAHDRMRLEIRDLACFGRPTRLVWSKRRWRCGMRECPTRTWTETSEHVPERAVLTVRVGEEACRQVGELARPVSGLADDSGSAGGP